jgi:aldose 1-epimerase
MSGLQRPPSVHRTAEAILDDGRRVDLFHLCGASIEAEIMTYGGIVRSLRAPDVDGHLDDVVLGFPYDGPSSLERYAGEHPYFGALIGRYGNRIAGGRFELDGTTYQLARNNGPNHLHGGPEGFHRVVWTPRAEATETEARLHLRHVSIDGEEGYPGTLTCDVTYAVTMADELRIEYRAVTDRPTIVNLTHHSYFNLGGPRCRDILDHELMVEAGAFLPVDETLIPLGSAQPVDATPFDLRAATRLRDRLSVDDSQLKIGRGFDHNFVLNDFRRASLEPRKAAVLRDPASGRTMEVRTTEPGLQVYTGGFLDGSIEGKGGPYSRHAGLCLETQGFPDSPNRPAYPGVRLDPGETYESTTIYRFTARA